MSSTLRAGLIGAHLSHSLSPEIHRALGDYDYRLFELAAHELGSFLGGDSFDALNVTIPYKRDVMPYLDEISAAATRIGAVNTVVRREDGSLFGHNTDYDGFADLVRDCGVPLTGKHVVVLGSGGASRTVVCVAEDMGARRVSVVSRSGEYNYRNLHLLADAEVVINTTPVGMYPDTIAAPLSLAAFPRCEAVLDLIYNPACTLLLQEAKERGIPHRNGLLMLVSQARRAAELFLGKAIPDTRVHEIVTALAAERESIALIGMPGCGKSTLGLLLAERLGKRFVDIDEEIVKAAGRPIPDILKADGEATFRALESETLRRVCAEGGLVIATGGGCVTRAENFAPLHLNGRVVFLDIPPAGLPTAGRPLSAACTPEVLYRERRPLYRKFADITLEISRDIDQNIKLLTEMLTK